MMQKYIKHSVHAIVILVVLLIWIMVRAQDLTTYAVIKYALVMIFGYIALLFDIFQRRIPNGLVLGMLAMWVLMTLPILLLSTQTGIEALIDSAFGFSIGGGIFIVVYLISKKGVGGGDVKFMAAAGLYLGLSNTIPAILYGTILAALVGLVLILTHKITKKDSIPLAPFLFIGIAITAFTM